MSKTKKSAKLPTVKKLEASIHQGYHFLWEWSMMPDSDKWRKNYARKAVEILYPDGNVDVVTGQPAEILHKRIEDTMQYLLTAGTEDNRNEDDLFRFHVLTAVTILGGTPYDGPIYSKK